MGKLNVFTLIGTAVMQLVVGYFWFGTYMFGDVVTVGGHGLEFLKLDATSIILLLLSSYGLTYFYDTLVKYTGTKDAGGCVKLGLTYGSFAIGFPVLMLLNLMGYTKVLLLVTFAYIILISILTSLIVLKLKKA